MSERIGYSPDQDMYAETLPEQGINPLAESGVLFIDLQRKLQQAITIINYQSEHIPLSAEDTDADIKSSSIVQVKGLDGRVHYVQENYTSDSWDDFTSADPSSIK